MKVAMIGLGNMGSGIAGCLLKSGCELTVWNRTAAKLAPALALGAKPADTVRQAVSDADVVISCLMDDQSMRDTLQGSEGMLAGMKPGAVHLSIATISANCADELDELHRRHGSRYVSGPVVGRPDAAAAGQLAAFLAGEAGAVERVMPLVKTYTKTVSVVSPAPRVANSLKLCLNYNVLAMIETMSETYVLAEKCDVPLEVLRDFYQQSLFAHPGLKMYAEKIQRRDFAGRGGFAMKAGLKDANLMIAAAEAVGAPVEIAEICQRKLQSGVAAGMEETDWSAIYEISRKDAGLS